MSEPPSYCNMADAALPDGFCAAQMNVETMRLRTLIILSSTSILAVERDTASIVLFSNIDSASNNSVNKSTVLTESGLTHGLAIHKDYLYASTSNSVYRWRINSQGIDSSNDNFSVDTDSRTEVITNINADSTGATPSGHTTRTLIFDDLDDSLYISVGSVDNVDSDAFRSRIRKFGPDAYTDDTVTNFITGTVFADGVRNEVGLAFDKFNVLWGVENGADRLTRDDLGGFITDDNPAEELNRFAHDEYRHYGYPYCWTEYNLPPEYGQGRGTVWAWPDFMNTQVTLLETGESVTISDQVCRTFATSELAMQGHSAPLGITFYNYTEPNSSNNDCTGTFPSSMDGYAFIAFHGSWNRQIPTGYKVVYVPIDANGRVPNNTEPVDLLAHEGAEARWPSGFRPVDVAFDECGRLWVTSDGDRDGTGSMLVRIEYYNASVENNNNSTEPVQSTNGFGIINGGGMNTTDSSNPTEMPVVEEEEEEEPINMNETSGATGLLVTGGSFNSFFSDFLMTLLKLQPSTSGNVEGSESNATIDAENTDNSTGTNETIAQPQSSFGLFMKSLLDTSSATTSKGDSTNTTTFNDTNVQVGGQAGNGNDEYTQEWTSHFSQFMSDLVNSQQERDDTLDPRSTKPDMVALDPENMDISISIIPLDSLFTFTNQSLADTWQGNDTLSSIQSLDWESHPASSKNTSIGNETTEIKMYAYIVDEEYTDVSIHIYPVNDVYKFTYNRNEGRIYNETYTRMDSTAATSDAFSESLQNVSTASNSSQSSPNNTDTNATTKDNSTTPTVLCRSGDTSRCNPTLAQAQDATSGSVGQQIGYQQIWLLFALIYVTKKVFGVY